MTDQERKVFADEISAGLSANPKSISSKWFYDEIGDDLFIKIMNMPEYYLTDCEFEIFNNQTDKIIESFDMRRSFDLYELGAGDGTKTIELLKQLNAKQFTYRPIDISTNAISNLQSRIKDELPEIVVEGISGEYFKVLKNLKNNRPKVVLFLGSNIGNLRDDQAKDFLSKLSDCMHIGDKLLLGVDLKKDASIILPAYNDAQGHTAQFNLNLLQRINRELGANYDLKKFRHTPVYDREEGIAKSYLECLEPTKVYIEALDQSFEFEHGERLFTEISRKYDIDTLKLLTESTGLELISTFYDSRKYFCDALFEKQYRLKQPKYQGGA